MCQSEIWRKGTSANVSSEPTETTLELQFKTVTSFTQEDKTVQSSNGPPGTFRKTLLAMFSTCLMHQFCSFEKEWKNVEDMRVTALQPLGDGRHLFSLGEDGIVALWDVKTTQLVCQHRAHSGVGFALEKHGRVPQMDPCIEQAEGSVYSAKKCKLYLYTTGRSRLLFVAHLRLSNYATDMPCSFN